MSRSNDPYDVDVKQHGTTGDDPSKAAGLHRRTLVKFGLVIPALGMTSLLSACGDDDPADPVATTPPPVADTRVASFGLAVLPDTQFYSRYATEETGNQFAKRYGSEPFTAQTQWLVDNAKALKIPFVIHVGDVVDQAGKPQQWAVADNAMKVMETAGLPYSVIAGNHDVLQDIGFENGQATGTDATRKLADEPYLKWFGTERAQKQASFGGRDPSGFHEWHTFTAEGQKFLVIGLSWRVSDAGIAWAQGVLRANPTLPTILVNHQLIAIANDGTSPQEVDYGLMLWDRLIRGNDQIFMTVNGHYHGSSTLTKTNDAGNPVIEMVVDYQMAYQGGNGLMRFYEFDFTNNRINALSFSPWVRQKPAATLNAFDQAMLTETNNQFSVPVDFAKRFSGFAPGFKAAVPSNTSLTATATKLITDGFTAPAPIAAVPPKSADDYPKIAETIAHWRFFGQANGTAVAERATIVDASGNGNALTRGPLNAPAGNTAMLDDLMWMDDHHHLSSAPGSIAFRNTAGPRLSYFLTDAAAAINKATFFTTGYTAEAFVKVDKTWTAAANAFMGIVTRAGRRGDFKGFEGSLPQSPPLQFAFSNLRELQWEIVSSQSTAGTPPLSPRVNWSGEIVLDRWVHVAVVNDPATRETTMYVEGAPVLRNAVDTVGLASLDLPWTIGGGYWDGGGPGGGFLGQLGEIRIVAKPLDPTKWLTARAV